ncbi:MAG: Trm112 family protein [Pseudomonadota bacterium]
MSQEPLPDPYLLDVLVCPITKQPLSVANSEVVDRLNRAIEGDAIQTNGGEAVTTTVPHALITRNGTMIYRIESGLPVLLEEQGITSIQLDGW